MSRAAPIQLRRMMDRRLLRHHLLSMSLILVVCYEWLFDAASQAFVQRRTQLGTRVEETSQKLKPLFLDPDTPWRCTALVHAQQQEPPACGVGSERLLQERQQQEVGTVSQSIPCMLILVISHAGGAGVVRSV